MINYTINKADDGDYIVVEVHGSINREIAAKITLESHVPGKELGIKKYFMDLTDAVNKEAITDQYHYAYMDLRSAEGIDPYAVCAGLVDPSDHSHDFAETVIRNAGFNFRLFSDRKKAMSFLGYGGD